MSHRFAVVYESNADFRTATELADQVLIDAIDWLDEHLIADQRTWIGMVPVEQQLTWKSIRRLADEAGIKAHGHINGSPLELDAGAARRAIIYLKSEFDDLAGILLIRDQDDEPARKLGLEQARSEHRGSPVIVIGLAIVEREAWVISGFEPTNEAEKSLLETERQKLGFHPQEQSHQLTACKDDNAQRSPKRVLQVLTGGNFDRERQCWHPPSLELLHSRGSKNGLSDFLSEVRIHLASLIGYVPGNES